MLDCPPRSHTWNLTFLMVTLSTLNPMANVAITKHATRAYSVWLQRSRQSRDRGG